MVISVWLQRGFPVNALAVIPLLLIITITIARRKHDYHPNGLLHRSRVSEKDLSGKWNSFAWIHVISLHSEHNLFQLRVQVHKHSPGECVACTQLDRIERSIHPGWTHLSENYSAKLNLLWDFSLCYPDEQRLIKATSIQSIKHLGESVQDCVTYPHSFAAVEKVVCNFRSLSVVVECVRWLYGGHPEHSTYPCRYHIDIFVLIIWLWCHDIVTDIIICHCDVVSCWPRTVEDNTASVHSTWHLLYSALPDED